MKKEKYKRGTRIDKLKDEFNFSDSEIDKIKKFLDSTIIEKEISFRDVLDIIIDTDELSIKQKVALSYSIGIFQTERSVVQIPIMSNMPGSGS